MKKLIGYLFLSLAVALSGCAGSGQGVAEDENEISQYVPKAVVKQIEEKMPDLMELYQEHSLKSDQDVGGKLVVKFSIFPDGSVYSSIEIVSSTIKRKEFERDICERIKTWRFSGLGNMEQPIVIKYPFKFEMKE